jgi:hypothetical protein
LLFREPTWPSAKKELSDPGFLHKCVRFFVCFSYSRLTTYASRRLKDFVQNEKDKISNTTLKQIGKYTKQAVGLFIQIPGPDRC